MTTHQRILDANPELKEVVCDVCPKCKYPQIQLQHVLNAIVKTLQKKYGEEREKVLFGDGEGILLWQEDYGRYGLGLIRKWNLSLSWDNQGQPVKDFVGSLLDN